MDVESRKRWVEYSRAKDVMFEHTDRKKTPWHVVNADDKEASPPQLHPASADQIPYQDMRLTRSSSSRQPDTL